MIGDLFATRADQIFARFVAFHEANPSIYGLVEKFSLEAIARGRKTLGIGMVFERIRWYVHVETQGDVVKINNDFRAYYARMFMAKHPEYAGFYRLRRRNSAEKPAFPVDIPVINVGPPGNEAALRARLAAL